MKKACERWPSQALRGSGLAGRFGHCPGAMAGASTRSGDLQQSGSAGPRVTPSAGLLVSLSMSEQRVRSGAAHRIAANMPELAARRDQSLPVAMRQIRTLVGVAQQCICMRASWIADDADYCASRRPHAVLTERSNLRAMQAERGLARDGSEQGVALRGPVG
jgi:hypothetical protein